MPHSLEITLIWIQMKKLTEELKAQILAATTQVAVDDLYRPYRPKRRTRATIAKEKGLEGLANYILLQMCNEPVEQESLKYVSAEKEVADEKEAIEGAKDIIAQNGIVVRAGNVEDLKKAKRILYLTDNCGEIVTDKILVRIMKKMNPDAELTVMVR